MVKAVCYFEFYNFLKKNFRIFCNFPKCQSSYVLIRPQNFAKSPPYFCLYVLQTKVRWRYRKILWPSQNIQTLQSNNLPNSLNTKHLFQKLYCMNPSDLDWSCSSLYRIYFISLDQKNFFTLFGWGSFNNYVDIILPFFNHLPTSTHR